MRTIRLIRQIDEPSGRGPGNGMYALQRALRANKPAWLEIGGFLRDGEIPWFWCWLDREAACLCERMGRPFIIGPNMLFANNRIPLASMGESELCNAKNCLLQFTESEWYRKLILNYCGPEMRASIELWPYPIDPQPDGPLPAKYDLLIYAKTAPRLLTEKLAKRFPSSIIIRYGQYRRADLIEAARQSRACVYLCDDDRGPLALAEILLCGCPAVGIERGAPWIVTGVSGVRIDRLAMAAIELAVAELIGGKCPAATVRGWAQQKFSPANVSARVLSLLDRVAAG